MRCSGRQSTGSFGWNVSREPYNGAYCMRCMDDCCPLARTGTKEMDTATGGGRDDDGD